MNHREGTVLVIGPTSSLARGACAELAAGGVMLLLAGRDVDEVRRLASDLRIRYKCSTRVIPFDASERSAPGELLHTVLSDHGADLKGVVTCVGWMGDPESTKVDPDVARRVVDVNYTSQASVLGSIAEHLAAGSGGFVIGVGSVAGERVREVNYPYGAAKSGFAAWLHGLRLRMHGSGVRVITVKPGFLDTRMTFGAASGPLVADPFAAGRRMVRALRGRRDVIYLPGYWRWIMSVVRLIPEPIFRRLSL